MRRKAVILGSPTVHPPLPGVAADHRTWRAFLLSDNGGAWDDADVIHDYAARAEDMVRSVELAAAGADYVLVAISSHGAHDLTEAGSYVVAADGYDVPLSAFRVDGKRQTLIVDACRGPSPVTLQPAPRRFGLGEARVAMNYRGPCRATYLAALQRSPVGIYQIHSCSVGEYAAEDAKQGGLFTSTLLDKARAWASHYHTATNVLGIVETFDATRVDFTNMSAQGRSQVPVQYYAGRGRPNYPIAVA